MDLTGKKKKSKTKAKKSKQVKKQRKKVDSSLVAALEDDEIVTAESVETKVEDEPAPEPESKVEPVKAFEGGLVCPAFESAINVSSRRIPEMDFLQLVINDVLLVDGAYIGAISQKNSFYMRTEGAAML